MSKDIKAIQCPKCGSTFKQEVKPDFYRCQNCGTEYYLDSDDTHIYHHHQRMPPLQSSASSVGTKTPLHILIGVVGLFSIIYLLTMLIQPQRNADLVYSNYKPRRSFYSSFVYCNTVTGDPVYLRMGVDYVDKGDHKSEQELHAQFNNAMDGKLLKDQMITEDNLRTNRCSLSFKIYSSELIYAIGCNSILLQLDTRNNRLSDVTKSTFKDYPQLSSGVAKLDFDYRKPMITVMNNEGETFYYFPAVRKLVKNEAEAEGVWKEIYSTKPYFEFGYMGDFFDDHKPDQLLEIKYDKSSDRSLKRNITPGRKYFSPAVIYQDEINLIIVVNTTAAPAPPMSIQKIDIATGKILWALPPEKFYLSQVVKCRQGYAIEYRKDEDADYVHGVMVVSDAGTLVKNYQLSRTE
jgi:DNA-directed RNA polymerase subunit M/transcription elongation factor TFIIS